MLAPIIEIFCEIDDFCKQFLKNQQTKILPNPNRKRRRECQMSVSEIMTIIILFHLGHYRTFKDFYHECVIRYLQRGIVETVIEQLKSICQIEHTRHRSPTNFISNILSALAAYILRPRKPSLKFDKLTPKMSLLTSS